MEWCSQPSLRIDYRTTIQRGGHEVTRWTTTLCVPSGTADGWHAEDSHRAEQCQLSTAGNLFCLCQWTSQQELWRGHLLTLTLVSHHHYIVDRTYVSEQRCWVSLVSARRASLTNGVAPPLTLLHSALCRGQSKRCKVEYNTHWRRTHIRTCTHAHIPGSQSCNTEQTCTGCTSSVTYTQSWALHAIHNVITHSELYMLKQCSQIEPLVSSTLQCAIGSALNIVSPADIDTFVNTPRPIPSTVRSSSDRGSPTTTDSSSIDMV